MVQALQQYNLEYAVQPIAPVGALRSSLNSGARRVH